MIVQPARDSVFEKKDTNNRRNSAAMTPLLNFPKFYLQTKQNAQNYKKYETTKITKATKNILWQIDVNNTLKQAEVKFSYSLVKT